MNRIALCADGESLLHPELLGLQEESLESQEWLSLYSLAFQTRSDLGSCNDIGEIWVVSSDDMEAINLAAALKKDQPWRRVLLFAGDCNGSVKSRSNHAGLDGVIAGSDLPKMYAQRKKAFKGFVGSDSESLPALGEELAESCHAVELEEGSTCAIIPAVGNALAPTGKGFVLPVVSGSGGVGKSTICVSLGLLAQKMGLSTVVVDLDLQFGDIKEALSAQDAFSVDVVVASPQMLDQIVASQKAPAVLAAPSRIEQAEALQPYLNALIGSLKQSFDLVVINTGCFWTEHHIQLLERCDKALFLMDQRPSALRACKKALDLCTHCGVAASPFVIGVNRCSKNALFTSIDASCALYGLPALEFRDGGSEVETLVAAGCASELLSSKNPFVESAEKALRELVPAARDCEVDKQAAPAKTPWFSFGKKRRKEA